MKQLTINGKVFGVVDVPEGATNLIIVKDQLRYKIDPLKYWWDLIKLPPGQWSIVCLASEATEAEAREIVDEYEYPMTRDIMGYENYLDKGFTLFDTALESLSSLLASKNLEPSTALIIKKED